MNGPVSETHKCPTIPFKISVVNNFSTSTETMINEIVIPNISQITTDPMENENVKMSEINLSTDYREMITNLSMARRLLRESFIVSRDDVKLTFGSLTSLAVICGLVIIARYVYKHYSESRVTGSVFQRRGSPLPISCKLTGVETIKMDELSGAQEGDGSSHTEFASLNKLGGRHAPDKPSACSSEHADKTIK